MLIRTTDDKAAGCKQMQTTREMQNGCPNQASYKAGTKAKKKKKKIKKEKERMVKKKGKREKKQQHFLRRKRRQVMSASKGQRLDTRNPCTRYNPLSSDKTRQGNRRSRTTPHKERMSGLVKHRDYPHPPPTRTS